MKESPRTGATPAGSRVRCGATSTLHQPAGWNRIDDDEPWVPAAPLGDGVSPCIGESPRAGADGAKLAERRRGRHPVGRPPRPLRPAGLLVLLLRELSPRPRGDEATRSGVRRRAGRHRGALPQVRARGRACRHWSPPSSGTASTTSSWTTRSSRRGMPMRCRPGRPWCSSTPKDMWWPSTPGRVTSTRSGR